MKGVIFNLLEEVVRQEHGDDTWDRLLEDANCEGVYASLGSYADEELARLVTAASSALEIEPDEVIRWFGRKAVPLLAERYPRFFEPHSSTLSFLLTLNEIIHPEVRKIYPGANVPVFDFEQPADGKLLLGYQSSRGLCALAEGLTQGAADHYGETVQLAHLECTGRGDQRCLIEVSFQTVGAALP